MHFRRFSWKIFTFESCWTSRI